MALDPDYAPAHVGIADFYSWASIFGILPTAECIEHSKAAACRALDIDDSLGDAYTALGFVTGFYEWNWAESERLFRRALEINPNDANAHEWYAALLVGLGRVEEFLEELRLAEELNPLSLRNKAMAAWQFYHARLFTESITRSRQVVELDKNFPQAYVQLGNALEQKGQIAEAIAALEHSLPMMPGSGIPRYQLCFALVAAGRREEARVLLNEMKAQSFASGMNPYFIATAHAALDEHDAAFEWFERAFRARDPWMFWLGTEPKLARLRDDPRFDDLLRRMNNPAARD